MNQNWIQKMMGDKFLTQRDLVKKKKKSSKQTLGTYYGVCSKHSDAQVNSERINNKKGIE